MRPIIALPFRNQKALINDEARRRLYDAGFDIVCNQTGIRPTPDELKELIKDAFGVIAGTEKYDENVLSAAKNLKVIVRFGVGTDNFDLEAMKKRGIKVGVIANYNAVAEHALALMLAALKDLPRYDSAVREGLWPRYTMREITGKTVGIVGFGRIGRRLCELLGGFGTTILVYDPFIDGEKIRACGYTPVSFDELISRSDIVSLHIPATKDTQHIMNSDTISKMKDGAYLVNTARGALIDEKALYDALSDNKLAGAALDVFGAEPPAKDDPLFTLDNVVLSPHVASSTLETNINGAATCTESFIRVLNGGDPVYPIL